MPDAPPELILSIERAYDIVIGHYCLYVNSVQNFHEKRDDSKQIND